MYNQRFYNTKRAKYGAFASLGLIANGVLTAILTPIVLHIMGVI